MGKGRQPRANRADARTTSMILHRGQQPHARLCRCPKGDSSCVCSTRSIVRKHSPSTGERAPLV
eukprot:11156190-Prorocentrum_lima.AAC.1